MTLTAIDLDNLDQALPDGFSIPEDGDGTEVHVCVGLDDLIQLSLITAGNGQIDAAITSAEAVRLAMALLALAESNR